MAGYVKVANEVFTRLERPIHIYIACRLYQLADMHRWGPFECSDGYLMERGPSKRDVRKVVKSLISLGLLVVLKPGDRNHSRLIQIANPAPKKADHEVNHEVNHGNDGKAAGFEGNGLEPEPHVGLKYQTTDKTTETPIPPEGLLRVLSALKGKPIESVSKMARKQVKNFRSKTGATVEELVLVAEAFHRCPAPLFAHDVRAEGWPEGSDRRKQLGTLLCQRRWDDRLSAAQEWRAKPVRPVREMPASAIAKLELMRRLRAERGGK